MFAFAFWEGGGELVSLGILVSSFWPLSFQRKDLGPPSQLFPTHGVQLAPPNPGDHEVGSPLFKGEPETKRGRWRW